LPQTTSKPPFAGPGGRFSGAGAAIAGGRLFPAVGPTRKVTCALKVAWRPALVTRPGAPAALGLWPTKHGR